MYNLALLTFRGKKNEPLWIYTQSDWDHRLGCVETEDRYGNS